MAERRLQQPKDDEKPVSDADLMSGGPEQDSPAEDKQPVTSQYREVTINGRKFQADPELYEAISQREKDFDRKLQSSSNELGQLRKFRDEHAPRPPVQPKDYDQLLFEDPKGAVERIKAEIRSEYQAAENLKSFWRDFYRSNKDLSEDEDHDVAEMILQRNLQELARLPVDEAKEKLADLTRRKILMYQQRGKDQVDDGEVPRTRVEIPSRQSRQPPAEEKDPGGDTVVDYLKYRRSQRAAARAKKT